MYNETNLPPNGIGALPFTPLLAPAAAFVAIFAILLAVHAVLAVMYQKYYGYSIGMVCGLLLEMLGYIAKVQLSHDRMNKNGYIMYVPRLASQSNTNIDCFQVYYRPYSWTHVSLLVAISRHQPAAAPLPRRQVWPPQPALVRLALYPRRFRLSLLYWVWRLARCDLRMEPDWRGPDDCGPGDAGSLHGHLLHPALLHPQAHWLADWGDR